MANISIRKIEKSGLAGVDLNHLDFGKVFCDHMLVANCVDGEWLDAGIKPYGPLELNPASTVLHYGQAVFEGMKAYRSVQGEIRFFRPEANFQRLNASAKRLCMPEVPSDLFMEGAHQLVQLDQNWMPEQEEGALYIRPFLISNDDFLGVKPASRYKFIIIASPVNAYYSKPLNIAIEDHYVRAVRGGVGEAKAAGNYAASLLATELAKQKGFDQLLWTDAKEHRWIEELGTSNFFCVVDGKLLSPSEDGSILKGITRDSVLQIAKHLGYEVQERRIAVDELVQWVQNGQLTEAFATGTAAALTPIATISNHSTSYSLPGGPVTKHLSEFLLNLRLGKREDSFGWMVPLR